MFDINICNATTGEMVCVIFDVDPDLTLDNLRKRIENEAREFITKDFRFTMAGVTLSLGQEETILVTNAIKRNGEEAIIMFQECNFSESNVHQQPMNILQGNESANGHLSDKGINDKVQPHKTVSQTYSNTSAFSKLKSPTNCSLKGIKVYSETEIERSSGKEKERRVFWNQRAKQLSKQNIRKADLYQQIHLYWRIHKDGAIKENTQTLGTSTNVKKMTFEKNVARVENARKMVTDLRKKMEECVSSDKKKMTRLKEEFSWAKSELRKAQDAFRKTSAKLK